MEGSRSNNIDPTPGNDERKVVLIGLYFDYCQRIKSFRKVHLYTILWIKCIVWLCIFIVIVISTEYNDYDKQVCFKLKLLFYNNF